MLRNASGALRNSDVVGFLLLDARAESRNQSDSFAVGLDRYCQQDGCCDAEEDGADYSAGCTCFVEAASALPILRPNLYDGSSTRPWIALATENATVSPINIVRFAPGGKDGHQGISDKSVRHV